LALVLSNDLRYLRLAIVAALWAALIGAFLAVKYRKHAVSSEDAVAEAQAVYELELEREIAARREFELEIEAEARQQSDVDSRTELDALRAEVVALRESLQSLFGGEVLYEHVALTAQATRMRSIKDERLVTSSESNGKSAPAQLMAGKKSVDVAERPTELIERVMDQVSPGQAAGQAADKRRPAAQSPQRPPNAPIRPRQQQEEPIRRVSQGDGAGAAAARAAKAAAELRAEANRRQPARSQSQQSEATQVTAQVNPVAPTQSKSARPKSAERSRPAISPVGRRSQTEPEYIRPAMDRGRRAASATPPAKPAQKPGPKTGEQPAATTREQQLAELGKAWKPSWKKDPSRTNMAPVSDPRKKAPSPASRTNITPVPDPKKSPSSRSNIPPVADPKKYPGSRTTITPVPDPKRFPGSRTNIAPAVDPKAFPRSRSGISPVADPRKIVEEPTPTPARHGSHRSTGEQPVPPRGEVEKSLPEVIRDAQELASGGGRRRRTSDDDSSYSLPMTTPVPTPVRSEPEQPASSGRRRRPDGEPPAWQGAEPEPAHGSRHSSNGSNAATNGSHSRPSTEPSGQGGSNGRRAAGTQGNRYEPEAAEAGSHAAGRSVNELLAALGASDSTPRRRRRAED
jgi:hypothetical protein